MGTATKLAKRGQTKMTNLEILAEVSTRFIVDDDSTPEGCRVLARACQELVEESGGDHDTFISELSERFVRRMHESLNGDANIPENVKEDLKNVVEEAVKA